jgi:hypothetical protein
MIRQSQKREGQFVSFEDTHAHQPEPFVAEVPGRRDGNRTCPIGDQTEKFHPHAVRRLYLAIVNRAILDVVENGRESREAKRWLLSRDFDSLQAAVERKVSEPVFQRPTWHSEVTKSTEHAAVS